MADVMTFDGCISRPKKNLVATLALCTGSEPGGRSPSQPGCCPGKCLPGPCWMIGGKSSGFPGESSTRRDQKSLGPGKSDWPRKCIQSFSKVRTDFDRAVRLMQGQETKQCYQPSPQE